jgi:carboxylesterase type B
MIRALMASPKAKGLFVRAIIQSDPQSYPLENRTISQTVVGEYALSQMGCTTLSCAQGLSLSAIVAATSLVANVAPDLNPAVPITPLSPTIDGTWVAGDWSALIASGDLPNAVDVIMGMHSNLVLSNG